MSYQFTVGPLVSHSFESYWFNSKAYIDKDQTIEKKKFSFKEDEKEGFICFWKNEFEWLSPFKAPFGSIECSIETDMAVLYTFLKEVIAEAKKGGVKKIKITTPPECYDIHKADLIDEVFLHLGFEVSITELNYHIEITNQPFEAAIHGSEKRRLLKCLQNKFEFSVEESHAIDGIHQLISDCRKRKGYPLSMNRNDFKQMFIDFPDRYQLFVVKDNDTLIAASVGVNVGNGILYNFLPADNEQYLNFSPMVLLTKGMYDYCQKNSLRLLDLGIATAQGVRNEGLIKFKEHLGGKVSHKYAYELTIE